jgi:hypothetical protein
MYRLVPSCTETVARDGVRRLPAGSQVVAGVALAYWLVVSTLESLQLA